MSGSVLGTGTLFLAMILVFCFVHLRRVARMRLAINQALHEIRRPLQALALGSTAESRPGAQTFAFPSRAPAPTGPPAGVLWQAIRAVGDLDRQLNGGTHCDSRELVACRLMVDACVRRWQRRARLDGAEIRVRWTGPDALVRGDGVILAAALENLLVNAIEHGGPVITVNALIVAKRLRIEVIDTGRDSPPCSSEGRRRIIRSIRRTRHGHGLSVVERAAAGHGGRFDLAVDDGGAKATLILPVNQAGASRSVPVRVNW
ncbi:MAG: ATP-binding protein [Solirubrobacterales bacterium]